MLVATLYKNNAKISLKSKLRARLLSGLSCGQSRSPARTVFIRDVAIHLKKKLKKRKKVKEVLIKRTFYSTDVYDYIWKDKETANQIIVSTNDGRKRDYKFERANKFVEISYKLKRFSKSQNFSKFIWLLIGAIITILGKFIYDWLNN